MNSIELISKNKIKNKKKRICDKAFIEPLKLFGLKKGK